MNSTPGLTDITIKGNGSPWSTAITVNGHLIPALGAELTIAPDSLPLLIIALPVPGVTDVETTGSARVDDMTRTALLALGWQPPEQDDDA